MQRDIGMPGQATVTFAYKRIRNWNILRSLCATKDKGLGMTPLCNLSLWEPRFGGYTWSWEA